MASQSFARRGRAAVADDRAVLAASAHLTDRDRYLVRMVAEHRVLTTDQLAALGFDNIITARHRLGVLVKIGALRRFRPRREVGSAPWHYLLGPVGAAMLGAEDRDERRWLPQVRADRQLALERSQRLAHLTGANWFFVALAAEARRDTGELLLWLSETEAARHFEYRITYGDRDGPLPNPDGLGTWAEQAHQVTFLLEFDTGSENLARLAAKLEGYGRLAEGLAKIEQACPPLLFCFPTPRREQAARHALAGCRDMAALRIATAAIDSRLTCPAGPVWLPLRETDTGQVRLIGLDAAMPDPWADYRDHQARQRRQREREARAHQPGWMAGDDCQAGICAADDAEDPCGP
jgi:hypothetical protein